MAVETIGFREPSNPVPVFTTSASCSREQVNFYLDRIWVQ